MSNEINDYDIYGYGYEEYNDYGIQDEYYPENVDYQINIKTDGYKIQNEVNLINNDINKENSELREKNNNFDHLTKKEFSTKNKINRELLKNELNKVNRIKDNFEPINENEILINKLEASTKPDFSNWSEDRIKEEIKGYGIRPTSIKNMIKQLNEIWEFLNLSKN